MNNELEKILLGAEDCYDFDFNLTLEDAATAIAGAQEFLDATRAFLKTTQ